jgi:hypothetical protein
MTTLKASVEDVPETDTVMSLNQIRKTDATVVSKENRHLFPPLQLVYVSRTRLNKDHHVTWAQSGEIQLRTHKVFATV